MSKPQKDLPMTGLPETVIAEFSKAIKRKPTDLTVTLRKPLDHQSNCLYDIWTAEEHFIAKVYLQTDELESAPRREFQVLTLLSSFDRLIQIDGCLVEGPFHSSRLVCARV